MIRALCFQSFYSAVVSFWTVHFRYHFALVCLVLLVIAVVDVLVAKVMKQRISWRPSSLGCGGLEQIRIFSVDPRWRSWRVVLTGEQGGRH